MRLTPLTFQIREAASKYGEAIAVYLNALDAARLHTPKQLLELRRARDEAGARLAALETQQHEAENK